jgi:hypothetical protein
MAYAAVVTVADNGSHEQVVTITETDGAAASEVEVVDSVTGRGPRPGSRLERVIAPPPSAGNAATRQPRLAIAAAATAGQIRYLATATAVATTIDDALRSAFPISLGGSKLYHRSTPDAGADNAMVTTYILSTRS